MLLPHERAFQQTVKLTILNALMPMGLKKVLDDYLMRYHRYICVCVCKEDHELLCLVRDRLIQLNLFYYWGLLEDFEVTSEIYHRKIMGVLMYKLRESKIRYRKTSNISRIFVGNYIVDNSYVVGASPVGAAPTTSSFST